MSNTASESQPPLRLCRIVTVPITFATLLREQINYIVEAGIDLTLVSSPGPELDAIARDLPMLRCHSIPMARKPSLGNDLYSLWTLAQFLRRERFDIIHSSTPKAGLFTAVAGVWAGTPIRIHTYTGQVWVEMHGLLRHIAREADRLIGMLDTHLYADSESQRSFLVAEGLVAARKIKVLGAGSISGVALRRFNPARALAMRAAMRHELGITETARVIVFVGRVTKDKGIVELIKAFHALSERYNDVDLVLVGPLEPERDPLPLETLVELSNDRRIHTIGFTPQPENYLAMADIFCLPTYREGFGSVIIEAGAMKLPTVATSVTGVVDAVVDGETGLFVPPKNTDLLAQGLQKMLDFPEMRQRMGEAAYEYAQRNFDAAVVNQAVVNEYFRLARGK